MDQEQNVNAGSITPPGTPRPDTIQVDRAASHQLILQALEYQRIRRLIEMRQQQPNLAQRRNVNIPPFNLN
jgi:hypothetical protein